jgi:hypothetical protein
MALLKVIVLHVRERAVALIADGLLEQLHPTGLRFLLANEQRQKASSLDMATDLVLNSMRLRVPEMETV